MIIERTCGSSEIQAAAWIKLHLLSKGIEIDPSVGQALATCNYATRKNFYNNPIWTTDHENIPQELMLNDLIVALNSYGPSPWRLIWSATENTLALENAEAGIKLKPELIPDLNIFQEDLDVARSANLYGGAALAFFSPRSCYFFHDDVQCGFCSLAGTAETAKGYKGVISESDVRKTVTKTIPSDPKRIEQIMIVGGNTRDFDSGFMHHVALATAASDALDEVGADPSISVHMATMPPRDLRLLSTLRRVRNIHVMFNLEVWDAETFSQVCPGKARDYGRDEMLQALQKLRDTIGAYRAHSLLVTGLESPEMTIEGATALAEMGISPIINIYHSDKHSRFGLGRRPPFKDLRCIAVALQDLHGHCAILPYWRHCGRNSIDAEASRGLFSEKLPRYFEVAT